MEDVVDVQLMEEQELEEELQEMDVDEDMEDAQPRRR